MNEKYGFTIKMADGFTGRVNGDDLAGFKKVAGKRFIEPEVVSVCVFNQAGTALMYLKKDENGKCVNREFRNES